MLNVLILLFTFCFTLSLNAQTYPSFGPEIEVTINGLSFDAMEPNISSDGQTLFFNNLNDGINTRLYYATKLNDSTFTYIGELPGANQTENPQLNAVADLDGFGKFYWTSTRDYPNQLDNLHRGVIVSGVVTNMGRVHGDFNKNTPGWLVMDHGISYDGQFLFYNNARFESACEGPCETEIGIAQKENDTTFNKVSSSDLILQTINNPAYIYYAPCITSDHLEFYYTRFLKGTITPQTTFEICVAVRDFANLAFSEPLVLFSAELSNLIEAPTLTYDKQFMYYHKKTVDSHVIVMRRRLDNLATQTHEFKEISNIIYPNPSHESIEITPEVMHCNYAIYAISGEQVFIEGEINESNRKINITELKQGLYLIQLKGSFGVQTLTFSKI